MNEQEHMDERNNNVADLVNIIGGLTEQAAVYRTQVTAIRNIIVIAKKAGDKEIDIPLLEAIVGEVKTDDK